MYGLAIVAFLSVLAAGGAWLAANDAKDIARRGVQEIQEGQQNGHATRAMLCTISLYDGDRMALNLPVQDTPCRWPEVIALYPPEICEAAPQLGSPLLCTPLE